MWARWKDFGLLTSAFANRPLFKRLREDRSRRDDQAHDQWPYAHRQVARAQLQVLHVLHGQKQKRNLKQTPPRSIAARAVILRFGPPISALSDSLRLCVRFQRGISAARRGRLAPPCGFSRWWWSCRSGAWGQQAYNNKMKEFNPTFHVRVQKGRIS